MVISEVAYADPSDNAVTPGPSYGGTVQVNAGSYGPLKTASPSMSFSQFGALTPGIYNLSVYATDGTNDSSTASKTVTLVYGDFSAARVYPNPWQSDKHSGSPTVKIFTVSGHLARSLDAPGGSVTWDLTNGSGDKVASGIYVYLITVGDTGYGGNGQKLRAKLAVIK